MSEYYMAYCFDQFLWWVDDALEIYKGTITLNLLVVNSMADQEALYLFTE